MDLNKLKSINTENLSFVKKNSIADINKKVKNENKNKKHRKSFQYRIISSFQNLNLINRKEKVETSRNIFFKIIKK